MSLLWRNASLSEEQHAALAKVRALPDDPRKPGYVEGEPVRRLMAEHNIVMHPTGPFHHEINSQGYLGSRTYHPHEELHASQNHLWKPALEEYIRNGWEHEIDHDYDSDDEDHLPEHLKNSEPYHPEVFHVGDRAWIDEGHHRILANRMQGLSFPGRARTTNEDDSDIDYDKELF